MWPRNTVVAVCCCVLVAWNIRRTVPFNDVIHQAFDSSRVVPLPSPLLCKSDQIKNGSWVPLTLPSAPYKPNNVLDGNGCYDENATVFETVMPWHTYEWEPSDETCEFTRWNQSLFCDLMYNKSLTIAGDSLSYEHLASLAGHLGVDVNPYRRLIFRPKYYHLKFDVCDNNTILSWQSTVSYHEGHVNDSLVNPVPDVLLLNVGAHYKPDDEYTSMRVSNIQRLAQWQQQANVTSMSSNSDRLLIYRTTVPGIPNCERFAEIPPPNTTTVADMEILVDDVEYYQSRPRRKNFHWMDFQRQNEIVLALLKNSSLRYDIIHAYEVNILRPDGKPSTRGDCLHNCEMTGKMEFYNENLLHILRQRYGPSHNSR